MMFFFLFLRAAGVSLSHRSGFPRPGTLFRSLCRSLCCFPSLSLSLLLKVGTSNPLLNLLNGAKPIYQLTHFRWIIYPFILSDNAADVTGGAEAGVFFLVVGRGIILSCSFFTVGRTRAARSLMIALWSHVSLIKHDAVRWLCCASAEKTAAVLFMQHGTCENSKTSLWELVAA